MTLGYFLTYFSDQHLSVTCHPFILSQSHFLPSAFTLFPFSNFQKELWSEIRKKIMALKIHSLRLVVNAETSETLKISLMNMIFFNPIYSVLKQVSRTQWWVEGDEKMHVKEKYKGDKGKTRQWKRVNERDRGKDGKVWRGWGWRGAVIGDVRSDCITSFSTWLKNTFS